MTGVLLEVRCPSVEEAGQSALFMRLVTANIRAGLKYAYNVSVSFRLDCAGTSDEVMVVSVYCERNGQLSSASRAMCLRRMSTHRANAFQIEIDQLIQDFEPDQSGKGE